MHTTDPSPQKQTQYERAFPTFGYFNHMGL